MHHILRASGAFFLKRRKDEHEELYRVIFYEYVQNLMIDNGYVEFFVEGTRSRSFKMLNPKFGMMTIITDCVFDG